jgi:lysophospholipase L1-like esterase
MKFLIQGALTSLLVANALAGPPDPVPGGDVAAVFAKAAAGEPLRCVALGGSITQAGKGWITEWLRRQFPQSDVALFNAGLGGTGSNLGVFRLERDVLSCQPDLVLLEYCVNDSGETGRDATRDFESIVVRLKQLPHPPALVVIEAATRSGVNLTRHRRIARHYRLLEVDLQAAVNAHLAEKGRPWETLFGDGVHPNEDGHRFYAEQISRALEPYLPGGRLASTPPAARELPPPLSKSPLLLDGHMIDLSTLVAAPGWSRELPVQPGAHPNFRGALVSQSPGSPLRLKLRGTNFGVFFPMNEGYGAFRAQVDEERPLEIAADLRSGYQVEMLAADLHPGTHEIVFVHPESSETPRPVKLGYLLVAGSSADSASRGQVSAERVKLLSRSRFEPLRASEWQWTGPFGEAPTEPDARSLMEKIYAPENPGQAASAWQPVPSESSDDGMNFPAPGGKPGVVYLRCEIPSATTERALLRINADYFAVIWLNGERVGELLDQHRAQEIFPVTLRPGSNHLMIKLGSGSKGFHLEAALGRIPADPAPPAANSQPPSAEAPPAENSPAFVSNHSHP